MKKEEILQLLPERLQRLAGREAGDWEQVQEIRIRSGRQMVLLIRGEKKIPGGAGEAVSAGEFREILEHISCYSLYAFEEEIRKGYITIPGGHRIGVAGRAVMEQGQVRTLRNITFLNIRISHEVKGCADRLLPRLMDADRFLSTLLISPPGAGKTTLLRDIVRQLAEGERGRPGKNVSVVDERSEIAGCYLGVPQKDVGPCDVMDACAKSEGIRMMIRSMAPEVIAVDEIGTRQDYEAMAYALTSGCALLATVHGDSLKHLREKPLLRQMLEEEMFGRLVFLRDEGRPGKIVAVCDGKGKELSRGASALTEGRAS